MHDDNWTFNSMDAKTGYPTFHTWGLKIYLLKLKHSHVFIDDC